MIAQPTTVVILRCASNPGDPTLRDGAAGRKCASSSLVRAAAQVGDQRRTRVDVALRSITGPLLLTDLNFFRDRDQGLHLVPARGGLSVKLGRHGVEIGTRLPWNCLWDRTAGLECAAAQIVRACRSEHQG